MALVGMHLSGSTPPIGSLGGSPAMIPSARRRMASFPVRVCQYVEARLKNRVDNQVGDFGGGRPASTSARILIMDASPLGPSSTGDPAAAGPFRSESAILVRTAPGQSTVTPTWALISRSWKYSASESATTACLEAP